MKTYRSIAAIGVATAALGLAWAEEPQEHRQLGPHEHGVATLRLAQEGGTLQLELSSPAVNIVGFEHAPASAEDHEALERAVDTLRDGARLFRFPEQAECRLTEVEVETPLLAEGGTESHEDHAHSAGEHERGHEDEHHSEPGDAHREAPESGEHHEHAEAHADIQAAYSFVCAKPEAVKRVEVGLFKAFPATQRVQAEYVLAAGQGARQLTIDDPNLRF